MLFVWRLVTGVWRLVAFRFAFVWVSGINPVGFLWVSLRFSFRPPPFAPVNPVGFRSDAVINNLRVCSLVVPAVCGEREELRQHRLNGLAILGALSAQQSGDLTDVFRQLALVGVVPIQRPAIEAILKGRQVRCSLEVIAHVVLVVMHRLRPRHTLKARHKGFELAGGFDYLTLQRSALVFGVYRHGHAIACLSAEE